MAHALQYVLQHMPSSNPIYLCRLFVVSYVQLSQNLESPHHMKVYQSSYKLVIEHAILGKVPRKRSDARDDEFGIGTGAGYGV